MAATFNAADPLTAAEIAAISAYYASQGETLTSTGTGTARIWTVTYKGKPSQPFTDEQLVTVYDAAQGSSSGSSQFLNPFGNLTTRVNGAVSAAEGAAGAAQTVGSFLGQLSNPALWTRVAEFAVGGLLLVIGVNAILHNPLGKVSKTAIKVAPK